ncbi:ultraviolet-B receptor [Acrasis kona]|uniref:Ultraviolet-B receptor n=1 Tax=Acrasis kona TaxID=1008807 RepID=A0AAW2YIK1_9EUKA
MNYHPIKSRKGGEHHRHPRHVNSQFDPISRIYVCGSNIKGQLSNPNLSEYNEIKSVQLPSQTEIKFVDCGFHSTYIVEGGNSLFVCGDNIYGQLGVSGLEWVDAFIQVPHQEWVGRSITGLYCGGTHAIIRVDEDIYVTGNNTNGQLGLGDRRCRYKFTKLCNVKIKEISCGSSHTVILTEGDKLWSCGWNDDGQLCLHDNLERKLLTHIPHNIKGIDQIKCGNYHTLVLNLNKELYTSGYNAYGQLGNGGNMATNHLKKVLVNFLVKSIFSCSAHTIILSECGKVYGSGCNGSGQLGTRHKEDDDKLKHIEIKTKGKIVDVSCRFGNHSLVMTDLGEVLATGRNKNGQLARLDKSDTCSFERIDETFHLEVPYMIRNGMYHKPLIDKRPKMYLLDPSLHVIHFHDVVFHFV